jgi:hypothetical protein
VMIRMRTRKLLSSRRGPGGRSAVIARNFAWIGQRCHRAA